MIVIKPVIISNANLTSSTVAEADYAAWAAGTTYALGDKVIYVNPSKTVTISNASPAVITWTAHALTANTAVVFTTTGSLPTGITAGTTYYVISPDTNTFQVSTSQNGAPISTSSAGSGTHTGTATVHKIYQSLQAANVGNVPPANVAWWSDLGATNRWKMFDGSVTSQTLNADSINTVLTIPDRVDSVAVLNVSAASVTVTQTDATDGVVYNNTFSLVADSGITDWFAWFFEPIVRKQDFLIQGLQAYVNSAISVTLTDTGNTAACGALVVGMSKDYGGTQYGASVGIQDYSVKTQDAFGNYTILQRAFRKTGNFQVWVDKTMVDYMQNNLAQMRATPALYVGSGEYGSTMLYGFYKDFSLTIDYPTVSICNITIEGLT